MKIDVKLQYKRKQQAKAQQVKDIKPQEVLRKKKKAHFFTPSH